MDISLKSDRAEKLARQDAADLAEAVMVISRRCSSLPDLDTRSADAILGYDEKGAVGCSRPIEPARQGRL
jgi:hypothetical protein